jgi:drug/metabolite transporter (DMT)-like permease
VNQNVSLRIVASRCQTPEQKKAQDFASPPQDGESLSTPSSPYCGFPWFEKRDNMNALLYGLVVVIWGTTWIAIFLQQGPVAAPVSIFWRFALASATMMVVLLALGRLRKLALRDHLFCVLQGCCVFCFNFWCFYTAAAHINTGLESVIFSMAVLYNAINSFIFFGQRPPARFWTAAALGLVGIITLFWDDLLASGWSVSLLTGIGLSALGTYGFSLGNMISMRHQHRGLETMTTNAWAMLYGTLVMGCIALFRGDSFAPQWTMSYMGALVYLALFGSVIAFGAYFTLVGRIGPGKAAYSTLLFPLVALSISTVYEGYVWHINGIIGLLLILGGNMVMFTRPETWFRRLRTA